MPRPTHIARFALLIVLCAIPLLRVPGVAADDWLPIAPEDLALTDNPASPGADAMILYRENAVDASNVMVDGDHDREYFRIKIFTQAGTKYGNVEVPIAKQHITIKDVSGRTIEPDGSIVKFEGKVLESTLTKRSGITVIAKTFTLPDVRPGSIIEYKFTRQGDPQWVHDLSWQVSQEIFTRDAHFSMKPYAGSYQTYFPFYRLYNLPPDTKMALDKTGRYSMDVHNIAPLVDEELMPSEESIASEVEFFYRDTDQGETADKFWARQAKKWSGDLDRFIDKKEALQSEVSKAISTGDAPETKLAKLYARAQKIRNLDDETLKTKKELADENIKPNSNVADLVTHGYGHGREINYFFIGLARAAGFQADGMRISPVTGQVFNFNGEDVRQIENDDIVWVSAGAKDYYLDPAASAYRFNILPWYEQGVLGLRLQKPGAPTLTTQSDETEATISRNGELNVTTTGAISGKLMIDFDGQDGALVREANRLADETGQTKDLEDRVRAWLPTGAAFKVTSCGPWDDNTKPLHVEGTLTLDREAGGVGSRLLLPLELFASRYVNDFSSQTRINMIDFRYPYQEKDDLKFTLPTSFSLASLPKPSTFDAGAASYSLTVSQQGNVLEVKRSFAMKSAVVDAKYYQTVRALYGRVKSNDDSQVLIQSGQ